MAIQKPYDLSIRGGIAIDGNEGNALSWKSTGDLSVAFSISIRKNADNTVVWSIPKTISYAQKYLIPSGSIPNGGEYKIQVTIWNEANQSASSDFEIFQTSSRPVITVVPIGVIGTHDYTFSAIYSQNESVPMRSYSVYLYDELNNLISQSGIKTTFPMEQYFSGMKSDEVYYIEFQATSNRGLTGTTGKILLNVSYSTPVINIGLVAENYDNASIKLNWNIIQIIGETEIKPPVFIDNEIIDLRENKLVFSEGFNVDRDFTLRMWLELPKPDTELLLMKGQTGDFALRYGLDRKFHLFKNSNGFVSHYATSPNVMNLIEDGDCETLGKWLLAGSTGSMSLDSVNKKYGNNSIKVSANGLIYFYKLNVPVKMGGNYLLIANHLSTSNISVRAGNNTGHINADFGTTTFGFSNDSFKTMYHKFKPTTNKINATFLSQSTFNIDGIRLYEIDNETYKKIGVDQKYSGKELGDRYPFATNSTKAFVFIQQVGDNFNIFSEVID